MSGVVCRSYDNVKVVGDDFSVHAVAVSQEGVFLYGVVDHDHVGVASHGGLYCGSCSLSKEIHSNPRVLSLEISFYRVGSVVFKSCVMEAGG